MLMSIIWTVIWALTIWSSAVFVSIAGFMITGQRTKSIHPLNIAFPALCWATLIVFWFN